VILYLSLQLKKIEGHRFRAVIAPPSRASPLGRAPSPLPRLSHHVVHLRPDLQASKKPRRAVALSVAQLPHHMTSPLGARLQVRPSQLPTRGNRAQSLPAPSPSPSPSFPTLHSSAAPRTSPRSAIMARVVDLAVGRPAPSTSLLGARLQVRPLSCFSCVLFIPSLLPGSIAKQSIFRVHCN